MDDAYEENDWCGAAKFLTPGTYTDLQMCDGENDWFGVNVVAGDTFTVTILFSHAQGDLDLALYDVGCGSSLTSSYSRTDNEQVTHTAGADGDYRFVIYKGGTDLENAYDIVLEVSSARRHRVYLPIVMK